MNEVPSKQYGSLQVNLQHPYITVVYGESLGKSPSLRILIEIKQDS